MVFVTAVEWWLHSNKTTRYENSVDGCLVMLLPLSQHTHSLSLSLSLVESPFTEKLIAQHCLEGVEFGVWLTPFVFSIQSKL